ncbi:hypothetical protein RND81_05G048400 [Saponaria officinalis]|uniref:Membrane protein of ER body-like protein n=1 Tax=Saponaria officinalis TaxID=3572 RepID=A0AAW1KSM2_SAPOF
MEVPYEEEEVMGIGMEEHGTAIMNKLSNPSFSKPISPTISDSSSCVSSESSGDSNSEFLAKFGTHNITTDAQFHKLITPVLQEGPAADNAPNSAETHHTQYYFHHKITQGSNGFSVHQNGTTTVSSLQESNGGSEGIDVGSNGSTFSKSPDAAVNFKYFETILDESSSSVVRTDTVNGENGIVSQSKNVVVHKAEEEVEPQGEEYDVVERLIEKQETHDLICPNCSSCITKRVILKRRKRKFPEISTAQEVSGSQPDQSGVPEPEAEEESQPSPHVGKVPDSSLDAISCFSCFNIFVPSGEGFLCWRFKPKPDTALQPDGTSTGIGQTEDSGTDSTGTIFPLWVVTCCQPAERQKPEASPLQTEPPLPLSEDEIPVSSTPGSLVPEPSAATSRPYIKGTQHGAGTALPNKPLNPIIPHGDAPSSETPSNLTTDEGSKFPLWIVTCCQPSTVETTMDHPVKLDGNEPPKETPSATSDDTEPNHLVNPGLSPIEDDTKLPRETPSAPSGGTESDNLAKPDKTVLQEEIGPAPSGSTRPPLVTFDDNPESPFNPESPAIFVPGTSSPSKPITTVNPIDGIPLPPPTKFPDAPGNAVLPMPLKSQPPVIPSNTPGVASVENVESGLPVEPRRHGVSGLDIVKAIVYGGLLESITSLSVITSAAGGDATTLNIVALGLANVFGGLVVLIHNLRVLKHEHTRERYESQLGRPGHYMLHAVVAIASYLVFGLMSPIIYGFTFRKSDNKDYKIATLAVAALACITLLSVAKAYVRSPPKAYTKTVFYYVSLGVMVSGLGYVAGDVINTLLKKFGIFDSRTPENVPALAAGLTNGAWSSF